MASHTITFDESRFDVAEGIIVSAGTEFDDSPSPGNPLGTGVKFICSLGTMGILSGSGGSNRFLAFFAPVAADGTTSNGRVVIRFAIPQKLVRFNISSDFIGATDSLGNSIPLLIQFRAAINGPVISSQQFDFGDPSLIEFNNPTQGVIDIVITSRSAENIIDNLFFSDTTTIPQDVAIAFDGSGSMASSGKWGAMIEAGDIFHDLYKNLGDPTSTFGGILFRWNCAQTVNGALISDRPAPAPLSTAVDVPALFAADSPQGCTPIGQGLLEAANRVNGGVNTTKSILLLTDGINNRGIEPSIASNNSNLDNVRVDCVGLGDVTEINSVQLSNITNDHGGNYRETTDPKEILDFFAQSLSEIMGKAEIAAVTGNNVTIATDTTKVIFLVAWSVGSASVDFNLQAPDGTVFNSPAPAAGGQVTAINYQTGSATSFHSFFVVEGADLGGSWTFLFPAAPPATLQKLVVEDLALRVEWSATPKLGFSGMPIHLRAKITNNGKPFSNAQVKVKVTKPNGSIGAFLAAGGKNLKGKPSGKDVNLYTAVTASALKSKKSKKFPDPVTTSHALAETGPGVFELKLSNTNYDGTYRFDLEAKSSTKKVVFHRRITLFCVLLSKPASTPIKIKQGKAAGLYQVTITPKAKDKRLIGPFLGEILRLNPAQGKMIGAIQDNLDGSYTQWLASDDKKAPKIHLQLLGKNFTTAAPKVAKKPAKKK